MDQSAEREAAGIGFSSRGRLADWAGELPRLFRRRFSYFYDARRIYRVLPRRLRAEFWVTMVLLLLSALLVTGSVYVTVLFVQAVSSPESLRGDAVFSHIADLFPASPAFPQGEDRALVIAACLLVVLFIVLKNAVVFVSTVHGTLFVQRIGVHVSREAFGRYLAKDYLWHVSGESGDMFRRIENRQQLTTMLMHILAIFGNAVCAAVLCLALFCFRPGVTLLVFSVFAGVGAAVYAVLRRQMEASGKRAGDYALRQNWAVRMTTRGIREVIVHGKRKIFLDRIVETMTDAIRSRTFLAIAVHIPAWFLEVAGFVVIFSVMAFLVDSGQPLSRTIATMSMLLITAWRVLPLFNRGMAAAVAIRGIRDRALSCLELLESFTDTPTEAAGPALPDFSLRRGVELRDVRFRYPGSRTDAVHGLSLAVRKGECVGVVGRSGAGKSTLAALLAGLFQPMSGVMLVDGREATPELLDAYRGVVGYVPQSPLLLPGTLAENIALSDWGSPPDRDRLERVCRMAGMEFALSGRKGPDYRIGDGGEGLSGGEAQRVAIARALYGNPEILIFDEATSSLDSATESRIGQTLETLGGAVTVIIIAHRLTTVQGCDRIVWLERGGVREIGPPGAVLPLFSEDRPQQ